MASHPPALLAPLLLATAASLLARGASAQTSPNCAINGLPCAPPQWAPTWNLTQSTVIQPGHTVSYFMPAHTWGLISLDWSVARGTWYVGNTSNTTMEATLTENCRLLKAAGLASRCFIYHNTEASVCLCGGQRVPCACSGGVLRSIYTCEDAGPVALAGAGATSRGGRRRRFAHPRSNSQVSSARTHTRTRTPQTHAPTHPRAPSSHHPHTPPHRTHTRTPTPPPSWRSSGSKASARS